MPADVDEPGVCWARPLGELRWVPAVVVWRDEAAGVAVLRLGSSVPPLPTGSAAPRWGRVDGSEPVAVSAVGIPSAQEHPDRVRDAKQLFGFITPDTTARAGLYAMTVLTASSVDPAADSPWEGMSGAALFAGPFLLGVVVVDPPRFGTDRVVATPIAPLLGDTELAGLLGVSPEHVVGVGPRFRLAVTAETSVTLAPPYRAATPRLGRSRRACCFLSTGSCRSWAATATLRRWRRGARTTPHPRCGWCSGRAGPGRPGWLPKRACGWPARGGRPVSPTRRPRAGRRRWSSTGRRCWS